MKRCIVLLLLSALLLNMPSCSKLSFEMDNISSTENEPSIAHKKKAAVLTMQDLMVIKLAGDYLKEHGETVEFDETEMILHYEHDDTVYLPIVHGKHIEYSEPYLEVIMYQHGESNENQCYICYIVYMSENGEVLGYNKLADNN